MNAYVNSLIAVMVVCQIVSVIAPDSEHARRYIRIVCALVALLTVLSPVKHLLAVSDDWTDKITAFFTSDVMETYDETEAGAVGLMQYVAEQYDTNDLSVVILTDESDTEVIGIQFYISNCPYAKRAAIEADLSEQLDLPVEVFGE